MLGCLSSVHSYSHIKSSHFVTKPTLAHLFYSQQACHNSDALVGGWLFWTRLSFSFCGFESALQSKSLSEFVEVTPEGR